MPGSIASATDGRSAILLLLFVSAWTVFHIVAHASIDLHPDLVEMYAWGLHPSAGYYKHPPLGALIPAAWFAVFPAADWSFHLLAMVNAAVALFAVDRIARLYLSGDKRLLVLLLLLLTPFYQFHAQRFASNQVLLSTWPIATYCFLRAFKTRGLAWSAAAGPPPRSRCSESTTRSISLRLSSSPRWHTRRAGPICDRHRPGCRRRSA